MKHIGTFAVSAMWDRGKFWEIVPSTGFLSIKGFLLGYALTDSDCFGIKINTLNILKRNKT
jgi:hypothetical protein